MNGFYQNRDEHKYTKYRWNGNTREFDQRSVIDYIMSGHNRKIENVKVMPGECLDSDHRLSLQT